MCSVEALFKRLSKRKELPHINPLVDLNNAVSFKYTLPMDTHNLDNASTDIMMRLA
ncbi:phenylalanine--tRNA ligase beta subunit-related protein [Limosilactobacillus reuteri]|uniref:phenylalanine--tRNA ligase beta subunit-related protein n=1 Tax=Limosilactobacillus reuteri TaxID=1598 RepID=UPI001CDC7601|nr:phenylalanine--tRNA ligase beta subunit-related protein [Limosilactobacillus reuteri]